MEEALGLGVSGEEALAAVPEDGRRDLGVLRELAGVVSDVSSHFLGEDERHSAFGAPGNIQSCEFMYVGVYPEYFS